MSSGVHNLTVHRVLFVSLKRSSRKSIQTNYQRFNWITKYGLLAEINFKSRRFQSSFQNPINWAMVNVLKFTKIYNESHNTKYITPLDTSGKTYMALVWECMRFESRSMLSLARLSQLTHMSVKKSRGRKTDIDEPFFACLKILHIKRNFLYLWLINTVT